MVKVGDGAGRGWRKMVQGGGTWIWPRKWGGGKGKGGGKKEREEVLRR